MKDPISSNMKLSKTKNSKWNEIHPMPVWMSGAAFLVHFVKDSFWRSKDSMKNENRL